MVNGVTGVNKSTFLSKIKTTGKPKLTSKAVCIAEGADNYGLHSGAKNATSVDRENNISYISPFVNGQNSEIQNFLTESWNLQQCGTIRRHCCDQCGCNFMTTACILRILHVRSPSKSPIKDYTYLIKYALKTKKLLNHNLLKSTTRTKEDWNDLNEW